MKRNHRTLLVWQEAVELVVLVHQTTKSFPREEIYGLASQMRRAATAVPSNIAEGFARAGTRELLRYLNMAAASLSELDTQVEIARRLGYLADAPDVCGTVDKVSRLLAALVTSLKRKQ